MVTWLEGLEAKLAKAREALNNVPIPSRTEGRAVFSKRMDKWLAGEYRATLAELGEG